MSDYITTAQLKATLEITVSTRDADLAAAITAASRAIDSYCGRRFYPDADVNQVRYYSAQDGTVLAVDDLVTLTSFKTDDGQAGTYAYTWTSGTDFVLEPRNAVADGWPYTSVRRLVGSSYVFPRFEGGVKVTGKFGWAAAPGPVVEATTIIASRFFKRAREAPFGIVTLGVDSPSTRLARLDPDVRFLLDPYKRWRPFV